MPHVVESIKDGVDRMIEEGRAIESILAKKPQTPAVVDARAELKIALEAHSRAR